jgi:hypothetical protein
MAVSGTVATNLRPPLPRLEMQLGSLGALSYTGGAVTGIYYCSMPRVGIADSECALKQRRTRGTTVRRHIPDSDHSRPHSTGNSCTPLEFVVREVSGIWRTECHCSRSDVNSVESCGPSQDLTRFHEACTKASISLASWSFAARPSTRRRSRLLKPAAAPRAAPSTAPRCTFSPPTFALASSARHTPPGPVAAGAYFASMSNKV